MQIEMGQEYQRSSLSSAEEGEADLEDFDLDHFLHGISEQQIKNGHKHKHIGVS
jgi:hypothetical protein